MTSLNTFKERIEDYEVHNLLGKGGFASVYKARCLKTGIDVAIKMIDKKLMHDHKMDERVKTEVFIHSRLKHPSILELYNYFEDINYVYLVLELCQNGELQQYVKKKNLAENEVSTIMQQVVEGLKYLHSHNILHRDLSLSNLLLTRDMQVKIADFGLATQLTRPDEKHMTMCGTPNYISPEVASRGSHGLEADVWGLGCLLYTLLVGSPPFDTQGIQGTLTRVVMANYQLPSYLSLEAKDLINSLLRKNPKDRISLEQILDHPFMKRGQAISSNITHDSGIHTMSSRRDSAFSGPPPNYHHHSGNMLSRGASSDYTPSEHAFAVNKLTRSLDHLNKLPNDIMPNFHDPRTCTNISCNRPEQNSIFSNCGSSYEAARKFSYQDVPPSISQYSNHNYYHPDPGGGAHPYTSTPQCMPPHSRCSDAPPSSASTNYNALEAKYSNNNVPRQIASIEKYPQEPTHQPVEKPSGQGLVQLCSQRLLPTRYQTKSAILSILDEGEVCVEFVKKKGPHKKELVCEVMRISPDGVRIVLYEPAGGKGAPPAGEPPPLPTHGSDQIFSVENLPQKHWKKYTHACKFVELVRAKTPKITYYSDKAKCWLMENLKNFEVNFYEGGKVTQSATEGVILVDASGRKQTFILGDCNNLTGTFELMWKHTQECHNHCLLLEKTLSQLQGGNFPIIVGRRPSNLGSNTSGKENSSRPNIPSFALSMNSTEPGTYYNTNSMKSEKRVSVPGVGSAIELPNGQIKVLYNDGSNLAVDGKNSYVYQYPDGHIAKYFGNDHIPGHIIEKIQQIPKVIKRLSPVTQKFHNIR
ncbi:unnamed protein product [Brassicogethes aeneus]|uniref:Serine/threonine-protein kinase PLK4 n=1 Tax=Brassicogethes aeneus TaxID=1431903 RepID=A0A9P0B2T6_BRAAE|nr:unnamed protein product [Brassicogethes aeneus]